MEGFKSLSLIPDYVSPVKPNIDQHKQHNIECSNPLVHCTFLHYNISGQSFKMEENDLSIHGRKTCNHYASFPNSINKADRFGFNFCPKTVRLNRWGIPIGLGLKGGVEVVADGWGATASAPPNWGNSQSTPAPNHWGEGNNRPSGQQSNNSPNLIQNQATTSTQHAISPANQQSSSVGTANQQVPSSGQSVPSGTNAWTQGPGKRLHSGNGSSDAHNLQTIKEALLSSDGWGGENVNQETTWDLPTSPKPDKNGSAPCAKAEVNNGCDIWENNLRNGGAVPPKPQQNPERQMPINNFGGTWGEDEEAADNSSAWTGSSGNTPHWSGNNQPNHSTAWTGAGPPKKNPGWGPNVGWGEHDPQRPEIEAGPEWGPHKPGPHVVPRPGPTGPPEPHPGGPPHPIPHPGSHFGGPMSGLHQGQMPGLHQGPHGPAPHGPLPHGPGPYGALPHNAPGGPGQWNNESIDRKLSGWEEPSPPSQRRDDSSNAAWSNPNQHSGASRWKDMSNLNMMGRPCMPGSQPPSRVPGGGSMKNDQRMWGQHGRNGNWGTGWNHQNKKEELETVLRTNSIGLDESMMDLGARGGGVAGVGEPWRNTSSLDDHSSNPFPDIGNPNFQQIGINSPQLASVSNRSQHISALMQHIQIAAQNGYLNPQILNQPLAPNTLHLVNNMLNQISLLQKCLQQQSLCNAQSYLKQGGSSSHNLFNVHITKAKQQISTLQSQIDAQQALHMKQLQQHQPQQPPSQLNTHNSGVGGGGPLNAQNEFFKPNLPDQLYSSFNQMGVNEGHQISQPPQSLSHNQQIQQNQQQQHHQGSRLNQWKLPNVDTEESINMMNNDFVRAPGKPSLPQSQSANNLNPLLPGSNSAWSLNSRPSESGWPDSNSVNCGDGISPLSGETRSLGSLNSPWASSSQAVSSSSYGLDIKAFEPGKQWMVKNIADDPTITPGSVTRSPLSLGIKDSDLLTSASKAPASRSVSEIGSSLSLSSNTWSFNPSSGQPSNNSLASVRNKSSSWREGTQSSTALTSELWGASVNSRTRGPPPGMSTNKSGDNGSPWDSAMGRSTSWSGEQQRNPSNSALQSAPGANPWPNSQMPSTWLLLKNLTTQIDGSTLKTLCMQHGPLINFHLSLNHGLALVNYGSREEASKAQENLNNCLLSNTTILADFASDPEVKQILGQLAPASVSSKDSWEDSGEHWATDPTSGASLWGGDIPPNTL